MSTATPASKPALVLCLSEVEPHHFASAFSQTSAAPYDRLVIVTAACTSPETVRVVQVNRLFRGKALSMSPVFP